MSVKLGKLQWRPFWASHIGALKGCLDYLGIRMSDAWLAGGIGHAFVLNVNANVSAAGPTAWNTEMMRLLGHNLGYNVTGISAWKHDPEFGTKQKLAWETAKRALDQGLPCYGWELGIAEYYAINGYNQYGYYYSGIGTASFKFDLEKDRKGELTDGVFTDRLRDDLALRGMALSEDVTVNNRFGCWIIKDEEEGTLYSILEDESGRLMLHGEYETSQGFKQWDDLGASTIGLMELYSVEPAYTSDDAAVVKEALEFALEFAESPRKWVQSGFRSGLAGYDAWKHALDNRSADGFGHAYNAAVWQECRMLASMFLLEAADRIGGGAAARLREAAKWYDDVSRELAVVAERFPFHRRRPEHIRDSESLDAASRALSRAQSAEQRGLERLRHIVGLLDG
ncbi:hypothetical protein FE783_27595 [Paenibacillus mesophilus]|uniref:hypothetical protein n=1 Tax=Paenibacillus mesophilus TaxID=2582849 RepID=UPI00110DC4D0|nr:hypothetical protein [Paenibacillus mesophilus]TMV45909.1 hypothetical protein FE783_27595 [Paenibacillus mesophilus]